MYTIQVVIYCYVYKCTVLFKHARTFRHKQIKYLALSQRNDYTVGRIDNKGCPGVANVLRWVDPCFRRFPFLTGQRY
jgi:hypothetical protein